MTNRITEKDLKEIIARLNEVKPGNDYRLYCAYGAYALESHGGKHRIFGLDTKRDLYQQIRCFLSGIHANEGSA